MMNKLREVFADKRVLLLGYGKEGLASYNLLQELNTQCTIGIADSSPTLTIPSDATAHLGDTYLEALSSYDIILRSPGIPLSDAIWKCSGDKITSQTEIFLQYFSGITIGITGTKGKTTTSSLLYSILLEGNRPVHLLGNIGTPIFSVLSSIKPNHLVVLELSSHQLQNIRATPAISALLNLYPEHLEYYGSFQHYKSAKLSILQKGNIPNSGFINRELFDATKHFHHEREITWIDSSMAKDLPYTLPQSLAGIHQKSNALFATEIAASLHFSPTQIQAGCTNYSPPPHRTESLGTIRGIHFVNDSAATIPEATIAALESFPNTKTLIVGGFNRGIDLKKLIVYLVQQPTLNILCIPETGNILYEGLLAQRASQERVLSCTTLEDAVQTAFFITPKDTTCLFSPAGASYHLYSNYGERGVHFRELVNLCTRSERKES